MQAFVEMLEDLSDNRDTKNGATRATQRKREIAGKRCEVALSPWSSQVFASRLRVARLLLLQFILVLLCVFTIVFVGFWRSEAGRGRLPD